MAKLFMTVGIPGCGKSSFFNKNVTVRIGTKHISSDDIRKELYDDETCQDNPTLVFRHMKERTIAYLEAGHNVYYDATNINAKKRMATIQEIKQQVKDVEFIAMYFNTPFGVCVERDKSRPRTVGIDVIEKMYKSLQVPQKSEGFDKVHILAFSGTSNFRFHADCYEIYLQSLSAFEQSVACVNFEQHNPYHSLTVSEHMYEAYKYAVEKEMPSQVQIAARLHDIGKPFCQVFEGEYARYFGHDSVGAQLAIPILLRCGTDKDKILEIVELIQLHMQAHQLENASEKTKNKLKNRIGETQYERLMMLHECDMSTK